MATHSERCLAKVAIEIRRARAGVWVSCSLPWGLFGWASLFLLECCTEQGFVDTYHRRFGGSGPFYEAPGEKLLSSEDSLIIKGTRGAWADVYITYRIGRADACVFVLINLFYLHHLLQKSESTGSYCCGLA